MLALCCGQGGIQIGDAFLALWELQQQQDGGTDGTIRDAGGLRVVSVDSEAKVLLGSRLKPHQRHVMAHSGCGNNWACGYQLAAGEADCSDSPALSGVMDGVRREAERCDGLPDLLLLHSLGGGTGSGVGSRLLEAVRDALPKATLGAVSVAPSRSGDCPMQALNATLALAHLAAHADAVLLFDNTALAAGASSAPAPPVAAGRAQPQRQARQASRCMGEVNREVAAAVVGALWPLRPTDPLAGRSRLRHLAASVCCDPCAKLCEARCVALGSGASVPPWQEALGTLAAAFPRHDPLDGGAPVATFAAALAARGLPRPAYAPGGAGLPSPAAAMAGTWPGWAGSAADVTLAVAPHGLAGLHCSGGGGGGTATGSRAQACLSAVCVRSSTGHLMAHHAHRALALAKARAYMHWFERFGCSVEDVNEAAAAVLHSSSWYLLGAGV